MAVGTKTDLSGLIQKIEDEARRLRDEGARLCLAQTQIDCPVSETTPTNLTSGTLRESLKIFDYDDASPIFSASIGSDLKYAQYTDEVDAGPHLINASRSPFLRFWWDPPAPWAANYGAGIWEFISVNHPGTKGRRWFSSKMPERWQAALARVRGA